MTMLAGIVCALPGLAWSNGDTFFNSKELVGHPEFVIFGNVKDDRGRYLENAVVRVYVVEHMLEFTAKTDILGRYRTPDVGRAIKELGYEVDPTLVSVAVEYPGYHIDRREYRGRRRQSNGAIEINFRMARNTMK